MEDSFGIMGLKEDEIELDLGLSIGGSFGKAEKLNPIKKESKPKSNSAADLGESVGFDPQTKREIQALRRQEAKKKREEKQQKRGITISSRSHQNGEFRGKDDDADADATEERECKKNKVQDFSGNANPNISAEVNNPLVLTPVPVPCPYPQVQFVPLTNGFAYSCANAVPCWGGGAGNEKGVVQPVATKVGFRPFQTGQDSGVNAGNGYDSEQNSSRDERNKKSGSNGSPMYSSSVVSDLQSSSNQGGCSSEAGTHASFCQEHPQMNSSVASNPKGQSEQSATSHQVDSAQSIDKSSKSIEKTASVKATESASSNLKEEPKPGHRSDLSIKPVLTNETPTATSRKDTKEDMGKPPKPQTPTPDDILSLRNMPCVSTTGNGPNGKTINGFLYRYTKSEVSIICVCHGSSFTPAEFVQHAGGSDVSHPLKHITVIPSAF